MKSLMRILHFHPDGRMARQFIWPLIEGEISVGHSTRLVTDRNPSEKTIHIRYDLSLSNLALFPVSIFKILRFISVFYPDVIISHNSKSSLLPLLIARVMRTPKIVYFNHGVPYVAYGGLMRWFLRTLERWNCRLATHVVTVSQDMVSLLKDVSPSVEVQKILNGSACGIDLRVFVTDPNNRDRWRATHSIDADDFLVVFVGRPERRKGFELVLRLWGEHFQEIAPKLVLCGPTENDVLKLLGEVPNNVIALGFVDNVPAVLASSDLLILPSLHEGLSYACIEAQASGVVVIANDIPGIRSIIENGVNGFLIPSNELTAYANLIKKIFENKELGPDIKRQARINAEKFSRDEFIPAYLDFLKCLAESRLS